MKGSPALAIRPPVDRGALLSPEQVAALVGRSPEWCRRQVPHKVVLGHSTVRWFERDVLDWLESRRQGIRA